MEKATQRAESVLKQATFCVACNTKCLHMVIYRDTRKVTIECGHCGFVSNRYRRASAKKSPSAPSAQS